MRIAPTELARFYREHAPALRLFARQWCDGGEDLVQDAFVRLAQQSQAPERVLPWLPMTEICPRNCRTSLKSSFPTIPEQESPLNSR